MAEETQAAVSAPIGSPAAAATSPPQTAPEIDTAGPEPDVAVRFSSSAIQETTDRP